MLVVEALEKTITKNTRNYCKLEHRVFLLPERLLSVDSICGHFTLWYALLWYFPVFWSSNYKRTGASFRIFQNNLYLRRHLDSSSLM